MARRTEVENEGKQESTRSQDKCAGRGRERERAMVGGGEDASAYKGQMKCTAALLTLARWQRSLSPSSSRSRPRSLPVPACNGALDAGEDRLLYLTGASGGEHVLEFVVIPRPVRGNVLAQVPLGLGVA
jgi:hypothetical protein